MTTELGAWVADEAGRRRHAAELRRLVGRRVEGVRYVEIAYEEPPVPFWPGPLFDSLDFGFEMDLDNGETWSCIWEQRGHNEGIWLFDQPLVPAALTPSGGDRAVWDVTDRWRELGPTVIIDVTSRWARQPYGPAIRVSTGEQVEDAGVSDLCQRAVILHSAGGRKTVLTTGDRLPDGSFGYSHENTAVFFSTADAETAGVALGGPTNKTP